MANNLTMTGSSPTSSGAGQGGTAGSASRCDQGDPEIIVGVIPVSHRDRVSLRIVLCQAAFRVSVDLDGQRLVDQDPFPGDEVNVLLPRLARGIHHLTWGYLAAGSTWKTLSEVSVLAMEEGDNGVVRFRLRKGSASNRPFNFSSVTLEVF